MQSFPKFGCVFHPGQPLTHFCSDEQCLLPLCPACVKLHQEEHRELGSPSHFAELALVLQSTRALLADIAGRGQSLAELQQQFERFVLQIRAGFATLLESQRNCILMVQSLEQSLASKKAMRTVIKTWPLRNLKALPPLDAPSLDPALRQIKSQLAKFNFQAQLKVLREASQDERRPNKENEQENCRSRSSRSKRGGIQISGGQGQGLIRSTVPGLVTLSDLQPGEPRTGKVYSVTR